MNFDEITHCLSGPDQKIIGDMTALFNSIDRQTESFAGQTGLKCKSGCGACCARPDIETTVAEILPMAVNLWSRGLAEIKLENIRSNSSKGVCVCYAPDPFHWTQGRCGVYAYRPGLCRLFGFSARKDKYGQPELVTCKIIHDSQSQACDCIPKKLSEGLEAPLLTNLAFRVADIDPVAGHKLLPINQAIGTGLEKIGLSLMMNVPAKQKESVKFGTKANGIEKTKQ